MSDERRRAADEPSVCRFADEPSAGQWAGEPPVGQFADEPSASLPVLFDWIELSDLLIMLHITKNTLKEWSSEGELKCSRIKNKTYFLRQDIERFMYSHYQNYRP
jgi:hypothetical protein